MTRDCFWRSGALAERAGVMNDTMEWPLFEPLALSVRQQTFTVLGLTVSNYRKGETCPAAPASLNKKLRIALYLRVNMV